MHVTTSKSSEPFIARCCPSLRPSHPPYDGRLPYFSACSTACSGLRLSKNQTAVTSSRSALSRRSSRRLSDSCGTGSSRRRHRRHKGVPEEVRDWQWTHTGG